MSGAVPTAFLGIERSLTGKRWLGSVLDAREAMAMAQALGLPEPVARILAARGVGVDEAPAFLDPRLRDLLPNPDHLLDMDKAAERLAQAIRNGEEIAIFGDYDVDGATSSALLQRFIRAVGGQVRIYIPDRIKEGYGPNALALQRLAADGVGLVVTVDCGITAFDALEAGSRAGLDIVVVDHHAAETRLPQAVAVVNPNRIDQQSPHGHMAAVGVAFLLVVHTNRVLRQAGWYGPARFEPDLMEWLDIVALGTVCDVVRLTGVNRALVAQGLKVMARRGNVGLAALIDEAGVDELPTAYHLGYVLGPRVNAGGRVGEAGLGAALLTCDDPALAALMARRLDRYNQERQIHEGIVLEQAVAQIEGADAPPSALVFAVGEGWHPGVIGIVASRLKERYDLPACVLSLDGDTAGGSGRSIAGVDLGAAVIAANQAGMLLRGGGHAMAAGFSIATDRIPEFRAFLEDRFARAIAEGRIVPTLRIDGLVTVASAQLPLIQDLERLAPFGVGNPEPRFAITGARIIRADGVGTNHVRAIVTGPDGGARLVVISFRSADQPLGQALLNHAGAPFHLAGHLRLNQWQGRVTPQMVLDDAAPM